MTIKVKYLPEEVIEKDAEALLAEFEHARNMPITLPIPIECLTSAPMERISGIA